MVCSRPGFPVHHQLPEPAQSHVHRVSDAMQPSHPVSSTSPLIFNLSQHKGLSQCISSLHHVAQVSELQLYHVLPMNIEDWFPLGWSGVIFLQSKGLSRFISNTTAQSINSSALSFFMVQLSHPYITSGKTIALTRWTFVRKVMFLLLICCLGWSYLFFQGASIF